MQHRAEVAEARARVAATIARIDSSHLWRHVGAHAHEPAGQLIGQLEGLQIQIAARADQQRFEVLDERRDDELVAPAGIKIQNPASEILETSRIRGEHLLDPLRE